MADGPALPLTLPAGRRAFRQVLMLESRIWWAPEALGYDPARDLVLTFDHGLRRDVEAMGGLAAFLDELVDPATMHACNFPMYDFFRTWHLGPQGEDLFRYEGVDFGLAFRLDLWNDFTFYVRLRLCLEALKALTYDALVVGAEAGLLEAPLRDARLAHTLSHHKAPDAKPTYYFPVQRWMDERLRPGGLRQVIRHLVIATHGIVTGWWDGLTERLWPRRRCFIQEYHPTRRLREALQADARVRVVQETFSGSPGLRKWLRDRPIPIYGGQRRTRPAAEALLQAWRERRCARLEMPGGLDLTEGAYRVIEQRLDQALPVRMQELDSVLRHWASHPLDLVVLIGNLGRVAMAVERVATSRGVPTFMVVNGMLWGDYLDEAKHATVINAYSESIRQDYFKGMPNVLCLGDPRMDDYARAERRTPDREAPTVTVGAAGFSNIDLTSFLAVEFGFLEQVLTALKQVRGACPGLKTIVKVRPNGYREAYEAFIAEYFPDLDVRIESTVPMRAVLEQTDLYISFNSQSHFEASCLGIPCIYHKAIAEVAGPPFDGGSELVTTRDVPALVQAMRDFLAGKDRFEPFSRREVMERYIGPLDACNLRRNQAQVLRMLGLSTLPNDLKQPGKRNELGAVLNDPPG